MRKKHPVKASSDTDVYFVVLDSAGFVESTHAVDESIAKSTERQLRSGGRKVRKFTDYDKYTEFLDENSRERGRQSRMSRGTVGASKSVRSRKHISASTKRSQWIEHPVTRFYDGEHHNMSAYFFKDDNGDQVAMIIPVYDKKTDTLTYDLSVIDPETGKSRTIEKCMSSKEAMDVFDERKDYFVNASTKSRKVECTMKKRFTVKASTTAKRRNRVCASSNIRVYEGYDNYQNYVIVRDFNRGDDDTMIVDWDLSDDEVYDIADRVNTGRYNPDTDGVGEYGWTTWDDAVGSMNGFHEVEASTRVKRKRVCASSIVLDRETADYVKDFLRKNGIKFDSSGYGKNTYLSINANPDEVKMIDDYLDALGEYPVDVDDYRDSIPDVNSSKKLRSRKRVSASKRMRKPVKASFDPSSQYYKTLRVLRDNINMEFNDTIIGNAKIDVDDIKSGMSDSCFFTIWISDENGDYDKDTTIKIVSTEEAFANDTFLILVGMYKRGSNEYMEISRFGAKKIVADAVELGDNIFDQINHYPKDDAKKHFKALNHKLLEGVDALFVRLSALSK